jgi:hypothetical protein
MNFPTLTLWFQRSPLITGNDLLTSLFLLCTSDQQNKHHFFRDHLMNIFLPSLGLIGPVISEKIKNKQHLFFYTFGTLVSFGYSGTKLSY